MEQVFHRWSSLFGALLCLSACGTFSGHVGAKTTEGALNEFQKSVLEIPPEQQGIIAERNAKGAVRGALDELSTPERQKQLADAIAIGIAEGLRTATNPAMAPGGNGVGGSGFTEAGGPPMQELSEQVARGVVVEVAKQLRAELGVDGTGPLAASLSTTAHQTSASATRGVLDELTAYEGPCMGPDPQKCLDDRVRRLGNAMASGALDAVRGPLLVVVFVFGFITSLLLRQLLGLGRRSRHRGTPADHDHHTRVTA